MKPKTLTFKIILAALALLVIGSGWWLVSRAGQGSSETFTVSRQDLAATIQTTATIKPRQTAQLAFKVAGQLTTLPVPVGGVVTAGQVVATLAAGDASRAVTEARLAVAAANLDLEKISTTNQSQLAAGQLQQAISAGLATSANVYRNLSTILDQLDDIFTGNDLNTSDSNTNNLQYYERTAVFYDPRFRGVADQLIMDLRSIQRQYPLVFQQYQAATLSGDHQQTAATEAVLATKDLVQSTAIMLKKSRDLIQLFKDKSLMDNWQAVKATTVNQHYSDLVNADDQVSVFLADLQTAANSITSQHNEVMNQDLAYRSQALEIQQKNNTLEKAEAALADTRLLAPFSGTVTERTKELGETVMANETVVEIQSAEQFEIEAPVPEVDIAKIKVGDTGSITLDALGPQVVLPVTVTLIDPSGVVVGGVPTYKVTLVFTAPDPRVRAGMTANLTLTTGTATNVLAVPARALITTGGVATVTVLKNGVVSNRPVQTGLRAGGLVEIVAGLNLGDQIVLLPSP